jgi:hypothetical protein
MTLGFRIDMTATSASWPESNLPLRIRNKAVGISAKRRGPAPATRRATESQVEHTKERAGMCGGEQRVDLHGALGNRDRGGGQCDGGCHRQELAEHD